jgi:hypothetical protein
MRGFPDAHAARAVIAIENFVVDMADGVCYLVAVKMF